MPQLSLMKKLIEILVNKNKPVIHESKLFRITYDYRLSISTPIPMPLRYSSKKNKRGLQLRFSTQIDNSFNKKEFQKSFPANFIHSMDAYVLHTFIERATKLNSAGCNFTFAFNHDNFMSSNPIILIYLIMDAYMELYNENYLQGIENLTDSEINQIIPSKIVSNFKINRNFVG